MAVAVLLPPTTSCPGAAEGCKNHGGRNDGEVLVGALVSYKMLKKIGEGAFGAVWKARHVQSGEVVAIKSNLLAGGEAAMLREASMLAACAGNPAVVCLREVVVSGSESDMHELHLVMEYVGRSLHDVIRSPRRRGRPFSESETRCAMAHLLSGASNMHAQGVVHCDLKPGNLLVDENDGRLKICDLGLAKSVAEAAAPPPKDRELDGTLGYIAPELLLCQKGCGTPVDMWALGCIMAELIAGQPLFSEDNSLEQLISIVHLLGISDDVSSMPLGVTAQSKLRQRVTEEQLSPAGFDVLRGLLEYDPKDRLSAAAALNMPWFEGQDDL